ncbi:unnamed protein product [Caenorhabditis brenneri]
MTIKSKPKTGKSSPWKSKEKTGSKPKTLKPAKNPGNGSSSGKGKTFLKKHALSILLGVVVLALLVAILVLLLLPKTNICSSPECITLAHQLHNFADKSVDPCEDFYKYSCGKYNEHSTQQGELERKNRIVAGLIKEFIIKKGGSSESRSENAMIMLYKKCEALRAAAADDTERDKIYKSNIVSIYNKIEEMGYWPMMHDQKWDANKFDLNHLLAKVASLVKKPGMLPFIDLGLFRMVVPSAKKLAIDFNREQEVEIDLAGDFEWLCNLNNVKFNKARYDNELAEIRAFKEDLTKLAQTTTKNQPQDNPFISPRDLQKYIDEISFQRVISLLYLPEQIGADHAMSKIIAVNAWPFSDATRSLDGLIKKTSKEVLTNFLIYSYFEIAMRKYNENYGALPCEYRVIDHLPHASIRVFVRNHFNKDNMKSVSDLVEDVKKGFVEMIEASDWIGEKTKQGAVNKVQKMEKVIGYPEEMEATGALDKTFHLHLDDSTTLYETISQIDAQSVRNALSYVYFNFPINPSSISMDTNANYAPMANALTVLVPFMDEPLFDHTFPQYAKIAGVGSVLGHEIGHGFDRQGIFFDEKAEVREWYAVKDIQTYATKTECLKSQYNAYNDPVFGKKLNGDVCLNENIADDLAVDVSWRTFKNSNPSSEPKLAGFEDYDVNKLFFQIYSVNWCSPRATHSLADQLRDSHATPSFRINGVFSNFKPFAETFNCPAGSPMNPDKKCSLF